MMLSCLNNYYISQDNCKKEIKISMRYYSKINSLFDLLTRALPQLVTRFYVAN